MEAREIIIRLSGIFLILILPLTVIGQKSVFSILSKEDHLDF